MRPLAGEEVAAAVAGRRVEALARRGKYLVWELEDDVHLMLHLRMTGTLLLDPPEPPRYRRVRFALDDGLQLCFDDPRRFGTGELALGSAARDAFFAARLGVEPLAPDFTSAHLYSLDEAQPGADQGVPARPAQGRGRRQHLRRRGAVPRARPSAAGGEPAHARQCAALRDAVVASLEAGIAAKGASIDDFRHPDGVQGSFQDRFLVHRREGEPCPVCGRPVRKLRAAGRGTYVCEGCQPRPGRAGTGQAAARSAARRPARSAAASS